jgi:hypothetical protein
MDYWLKLISFKVLLPLLSLRLLWRLVVEA